MSGLEKALFNLKASPLMLIVSACSAARLPFSIALLAFFQSHPSNTSFSQFTAKQLNRQAAKANKDEKTEKDKLKKVGASISS